MTLVSRLKLGAWSASAAALFAGMAHAQSPAAPASPLVASTRGTAPTKEGGANSVTVLNIAGAPTVVGTAELAGAEVYGADGARKAAWSAGEVYSVDARNVEINGAPTPVLAALDRQANQIRLFNANGQSLNAGAIQLGFQSEGMCLFQSARDKSLYAFAISGAGQIDQWLLFPNAEGKIGGSLVRQLHVSSESSYCVADDATGDLYVTEDSVGVWKFDADPETDATPKIVDIVKFGAITGDVGGAALISNGPGANYLVVANQSDNNFNLYDRGQDDKFLGRFRIDGIESASGLFGTRANLGDGLSDGALIVADDRSAGANYRLASWRAIATAMHLTVAPAQSHAAPSSVPMVHPTLETKPVGNDGDAADDPAIWIDPTDPAKSLIVGTNKKLGLDLYDMSGNILQTLPDGKMNNVDLREGFRLGGQSTTLVVASDRTHKSIALYVLDATTRRLRNVSDGIQATGLGDPYGLCMYRGKSGKTYVFINDTDGRMRQWELIAGSNGKVSSKLVRDFKFETQAEGCVTDDENAALYVAEEDVALWRMGAEPSTGAAKKQIASIDGNKALKDDLEGVGLYKMSGGRGYLVVSVQGNNNYALFKRDGQNEYVGSFSVVANGPAGIDGVSETDGLDVTSKSLGPAFPDGALIAQDGRNVMPPENQNFKYVSWSAIAAALHLPTH